MKMIKFSRTLTGIVAAGAIAAGFYFFMKSDVSVINNEVVFNTIIDFPENDTLSANANAYLEQEVFKIKTQSDTVVESKDGILIHVPKEAFNTNASEVDLLLQGAINPSEILQAGLSTSSNGQPLETGGMFYLDAFTNDERVPLNKPLNVQVPTSKKLPAMALYNGEKTDAGDINWINPTPIENKLTAVPMSSLNFYPSNYESTLDDMGYFGKTFRDSLYYSFAFDNKCDKDERAVVGAILPSELGDTLLLTELLTESEDSAYAYLDCELGRKLFQNNCASCHLRDKDMTGPALKGARERWTNKSSEENLYNYIKNSQAVIKAGDAYANELSDVWNNLVMPPQNVTDSDIDQIFAYVECDLEEDTGVNPAAVQSIWNEVFDYTNLATKEFEARMPLIHKTCQTTILEIYIQHLDKPLYYSDSIAASYTSGAIRQQFLEFFDQRDGFVDRDHFSQDQLFDYYQKQTEVFTEAARRTNENYWKEQQKKDQELGKNQRNSEQRNRSAKLETFQKEFNQNLEKVSSELGIKKPRQRSNQSSYNVSVSTLGWKNIDREVKVITQNRETSVLEQNGGTSTILYEDWSATVKNAEDYDQIHVYNIPKTFNTYVKIREKAGQYFYSLNADINYQTLVVGWTAQKISFYQDKKTSPGKHELVLKPITYDEFKYAVADQLESIGRMEEEMNYLEYAWKDQKRINEQVEKESLRSFIEEIIFPCRSRVRHEESSYSNLPHHNQ